MILVKGIGWIAEGEYGCFALGEKSPFTDDGTFDDLQRRGIFSQPFRNFGRLDRASRITAAAVSLALRDAGIPYAPEQKLDIGIVGTSGAGSLPTDLLYYKDYVDCGRTLARGNLFIYTLPSSPLGEAAIHFGLQGPLFFQAAATALGTVLETAGSMLSMGEAGAMLAGAADERSAMYFVLARENRKQKSSALDYQEALALVSMNLELPGLIRKLLTMKGKMVRP